MGCIAFIPVSFTTHKQQFFGPVVRTCWKRTLSVGVEMEEPNVPKVPPACLIIAHISLISQTKLTRIKSRPNFHSFPCVILLKSLSSRLY